MKSSILLTAAVEVEHAHVELPMDPIAYGLIAFAILLALLIVAMAFNGIAHRH